MKNLFLITILLSLISCSGVKTPVTNQYQLNSYSIKPCHHHPSNLSLRVSIPEAAPGYQTEQMLYVDKPYQLSVFTKNAWVSPPAEMLQPLIIQSIEKTGFFYAVTSSTYNEAADYRLDTQLFTLQQNFLKKPSTLEFSAKVVLTRIRDNKVLASKIMTYCIPCPADTPAGGVFAANKATQWFTNQVNAFVISHVD